MNDTTPPQLRVVSRAPGEIVVSITDGGAGVDPRVDPGDARRPHASRALPARPADDPRPRRGKHLLIVTASDYQELKNMEDVAPIKPNTATLRRTVTVARSG